MELKVEGMTCGGCVGSVRRILARQLDLEQDDVTVDLEGGKAIVPDDTNREKLSAAYEKLANAGFPTRPA